MSTGIHNFQQISKPLSLQYLFWGSPRFFFSIRKNCSPFRFPQFPFQHFQPNDFQHATTIGESEQHGGQLSHLGSGQGSHGGVSQRFESSQGRYSFSRRMRYPCAQGGGGYYQQQAQRRESLREYALQEPHRYPASPARGRFASVCLQPRHLDHRRYRPVSPLQRNEVALQALLFSSTGH